MKSLHSWLEEYALSHRNPTNVRIHSVCVPAIVLSVFGASASIPWPFLYQIPGGWAAALLGATALFYVCLSRRAAAIWLAGGISVLVLIDIVSTRLGYVLPASIFVFAVAWIGQFIGHKIEGQRPSFLKDVLFLLIGPLFVLKHLGFRL